jgi:hypothetical protein
VTTVFIESVLIGMAARPLANYRRGPLIRLFETQASGDLREEGDALFSNRALLVAEGLRAEGHALRIFGTAGDRPVLDWLHGRGFSVVEATVPRLSRPRRSRSSARGSRPSHPAAGRRTTSARTSPRRPNSVSADATPPRRCA